MPPETDSPLEALEKRLYEARDTETAEVPAYSNQEPIHPYGWQAPPPPPPPKKRMPWTVIFLGIAGIFLLAAASVAAYLIFQGTRAVSSDRVKIDVQTPVRIASGDTVSLVFTIRNTNPAALNNATLYATLPPGTRSGDGKDVPFTQYSDVLGTVPAGGEVTRTVQVKLFGTENQILPLPVKVEYHTDGSNALYISQTESSVTIASSPISVQVQALSQSPSGQPVALTVLVRSNAASPVSNVGLTAEYPSGFSVQTTAPSASGTNFFSLGTLAPGEQKLVKITGILIGQNADQRVFRFTAGSVNPDGTSTLGNTFAVGETTISITHPFLNVGLALNNEAADTLISSPSKIVGARLSWQNTLTTPLTNASIRIQLSGSALDLSTISGGTGFYRSSDSSVIFARDTNPALASLAAGDTGAGSFSFGVKSVTALKGVKNPTVLLTVSVTGQQGSQGSAAQQLSSTLTRTIKIGTDVSISSTLSRADTYKNTGPIPPAAGTESTYTVTLAAKNTLNSVGAAKETFELPSYVRFTGAADTGISYNPDTHVVTWMMGDLAPGGTATARFQIGFLPSASQNGTSPVLVGEQTFSGVDRFTLEQVNTTAPALTSELPGSKTSGTVH